MLWVKALHIIFIVTWFAGLLYLPRLFVYHAMATDSIGIERFKIMERKLYYGIMAPGALGSIIFGIWLLVGFHFTTYMQMPWLHAKLLLVILLILYHFYLGQLLTQFKRDQNTHGHIFYRIINEIPALILVMIVILVVVKP